MKRIVPIVCAAALLLLCGEEAGAQTKSYGFRAIHFPSGEYGYIVGDAGLVLVTTDGGASWKESATGRPYTFRSVWFLSEGAGMIGGDNSIFLITIDAGQNWVPLIVPQLTTDYQINRIYFHDPAEGWVMGIDTTNGDTASRLMHTADGGHNWESEFFTFSGFCTGMSFQDASGNGVVVGDTSLRMLYGGSGKTWRRADQVQYPPLPRYRRQTVYDAFYTAPSTDLATTAYACGHGDAAVNEPTIYLRSDDGGFTWQYLPQDDADKTYGDAVALHFVDPTHGVAIGVSGGRSFVSRTEDGEHFVPVYSIDTSRTRLRGIGGSGTELWMIGSNCYLAHSSDFGTTWKRTLLCGPVGVERTGDPVSFSLEQNFPNPFPSGSTTLIRFSPGDGIGGNPAPLLLELYDALGRKLRTIASGEYAPGEYSIAFASGDLPAGMYYYRLTAAGATRTRAMMILRSSR